MPESPADTFCPHTRTSTGYTLETDTRVLLAIGCRKWSCKCCGPKLKARLVHRIVKARPNRMVTLTCRHEEGPAEQHRKIVKALPRLVTQLRSQTPIEYLRMLESCVDGYPHFHLLVRSAYIDQAWIQEEWKRLTGAHIVDIRKAHGASVAYVAKYVNKARGEDGMFSRQRISVSRQFWNDERGEELAVTDVTREHPVPYANAHLVDRAITKRSGTVYELDMRSDGDEWPPEFYPYRDAPEHHDDYATSRQTSYVSAETLNATINTTLAETSEDCRDA